MYCDTQDGPLVKILDVSFTTILGRDTELELVCGDPTFCAPEILLSHEYGTSVDMWALGVLLFIMVCGSEPFQRAEEGDTFRSILQAAFELDMPEWATVTMHAKDVVKRLLVADPLIRMTAAQTLKHDWIIGAATPDLHLPASQYDLRKYNNRSAKKVHPCKKSESCGCALFSVKDVVVLLRILLLCVLGNKVFQHPTDIFVHILESHFPNRRVLSPVETW
ncbi:Calcium/calmodulin-dependent protein kinase type IV [Sparganum proliferum]